MTATIRAELVEETVRLHVAGIVIDLSPAEAEEVSCGLHDAAESADARWCRRVNADAPPCGERIEWTDILRPGCLFVGKVMQVHRGLIYVRLPHPSALNGGHDTSVFPVKPDGDRPRCWRVVDAAGHRCAVCDATDTVLVGPARECAPSNGCTVPEPGNVAGEDGGTPCACGHDETSHRRLDGPVGEPPGSCLSPRCACRGFRPREEAR